MGNQMITMPSVRSPAAISIKVRSVIVFIVLPPP